MSEKKQLGWPGSYVEVNDAQDLDLDRHIGIIHRAFSGVSFSGEISRSLTPEFYKWKYWTPAGRAVVSTIVSGADAFSVAAACPLIFTGPAGPLRGWQVGDIATVPEARLKGLFRESLKALLEQLPEGDLVICFPNQRSLKEISGQGLHPVAELSTRARPVLPRRIGPAEAAVHAFRPFSGELALRGRETFGVKRDTEYLTWRYIKHPTRKYEIRLHGSENAPDGLIVLGRFSVGGVGIAVVMDFHASTKEGAGALLHWADAWARSQGLLVLMTIASRLPMLPPVNGWLLPIPASLQPKRHICLATIAGSRIGRPELPDCWDLQVGDWDGL